MPAPQIKSRPAAAESHPRCLRVVPHVRHLYRSVRTHLPHRPVGRFSRYMKSEGYFACGKSVIRFDGGE